MGLVSHIRPTPECHLRGPYSIPARAPGDFHAGTGRQPPRSFHQRRVVSVVWAIFVSSLSLLESDYPMSAEQIWQARNKLDRISRELTETNSESSVAPPPLCSDSAAVL